MFITKNIITAKSDKELFNILYNKVSFFSDEELSNLFVDEYYNKIKAYPLSSFKENFDKIDARNHPGNKSNLFGFQNHGAWAAIGFVSTRNFTEDSSPASDNEFINVIRTIPPEWRLNHYIYRKFLKKLSPELAKIPYEKTMVRADAPLLFWKVGSTYLCGRELIKKRIQKYAKGKILLPNKRSYVNFDEWFRTNENWQTFFRELLLNKNGKSEKYFNQNYIETLLQDQLVGEKNNTMKLLYIASFKIFLRLFF